jgi:hypothetical protein
MIMNMGVAAVLAIAFFSLAAASYTAYKAYRIGVKADSSSIEDRYGLEKDYYLVSNVAWITLGSRIAAIPLFFLTVISLVPSIPGAMCEFGVFQAGYPYSWIDFFMKLGTLYVFGGWLLVDYLNKKCLQTPLLGTLARSFTLITPILFADAFLDLMFFGTLQPLVVPCCRVVYPPQSGFTCPFCFVTYAEPLFLFVIPAYGLAAFLIVWSIVTDRLGKRSDEFKKASANSVRTFLKVAIFLAVTGTLMMMIQLVLGPIGVNPHQMISPLI